MSTQDNNASAYGASKGLAYVLPWDTMMQYNQQVEAKKQQFVAENEQKMTRIVDMEKEQQVGMPAYDKALENHYEGLHLEMGRVITKYRDPFSSIDGMREMKAIQNKYLNNEFLINAGKTKDAYGQLKADYANNRITPEGFAEEEAKYNAIVNGEATEASKVYQYARPDYTPIQETIAANARFYHETTLKDTRNQTIKGYSDQAISEIADLTIVGPQNETAILRVKADMTAKGIPITPESLKREVENRVKIQLPRDVNNRYYQTSEGGKDSAGLGGVMPSDKVLRDGYADAESMGNFIPRNAKDKSIAGLTKLSFGQGNEKYSVPFKGTAFYQSTSKYNPDIQNASIEIMVARQDLVKSYTNKIQDIISGSGINTNGNVFITEDPKTTDREGKPLPSSALLNQYLSDTDYLKLATAMGFGTKDAIGINDEYNKGAYANSSLSSYNGKRLRDVGAEGIYSSNALLFHIMKHVVSSSATPENAEVDKAGAYDFMDAMGGREKVEWVNVSDVNFTPKFSTKNFMEYDVTKNTTAGKAGEKQLVREISGNNVLTMVGDDWAGGVDSSDRWSGVFYNNPGGQPISFGKSNFGEIAAEPKALAAFDRLMTITDNAYKFRKTDDGKSLLEHVFVGLSPNTIRDRMIAGDNKSLFSRGVIAYQKVNNGEDLTPEEKILYKIHQEYKKNIVLKTTKRE